MSALLERFPERTVWAGFVFVAGFAAIAALAAVARATGSPFIFPSLGATAFLHFTTPLAPSASPRNTLVGHAIGIACGFGALWLVGLDEAPSAILAGVSDARVIAVAASLAATGALMVLLRASHPPAGATALIVSLGLVSGPLHLGVIELAVAALTLQAIVINRLAGIAYPVWTSREP
ncbi:HPP family protein [Sandaracinus amylolyticus]|uniref:HPP transmembrane region domain-containing protein n=1 Tax=Sandaracinus amylolyticus TaxID=927083 RepID=A0A0F6VZ94_9BACT|nr:HPP family protein [Sandaracinus amylolyticus]AKF03252.1 hypothetical protein DB32_000401 [Sandaracinus amylolyticus]